VQSGFVLSGDATTMPPSAPDAHAPLAPMLHSKSDSAIGLSVAMNESTERFKISASRSLTRLGSGKQNTVCKATVPASMREPREYMMGWVVREVRLRALKDERKGKASILTLYQEWRGSVRG
jgi:hypothetical protein